MPEKFVGETANERRWWYGERKEKETGRVVANCRNQLSKIFVFRSEEERAREAVCPQIPTRTAVVRSVRGAGPGEKDGDAPGKTSRMDKLERKLGGRLMRANKVGQKLVSRN